MNDRTHLVRNTMYAMGGEISQIVLVFLWGIFVPRYLGAENYGIYTYVMSIVTFVTVLVDFGMSTFAVRDIARNPERAETLLPTLLGIRCTMGFLFLSAIFFATHVFDFGESGGPLRLMGLLLIIEPLAVHIVIFRAREQLKYVAMVQIANRGVMLIALPVAFIFDAGITGVILVRILGSVTTVALIWLIAAKKYSHLKYRFGMSGWPDMFKMSLPFVGTSLIWEVFNRIDQVLIPYFDTWEANGCYGVAVAIISITYVIPKAANAILFPYFSRQQVNSNEKLIAGSMELYRYLGIVSFGLVVFVAMPAAEWIEMIWGEEFTAGAGALIVLAFGVPFAFLQNIHTPVLYSHNKERLIMLFTAVSVVMDIVLDILLIPRMGIEGAALATAATHAVFYFLNLVVFLRVLGPVPIVRILAGPALSAAAAGAFLFYYSDIFILSRLAAGALLFIVCLVATKSLRAGDIEVAGMIFRRRGR